MTPRILRTEVLANERWGSLVELKLRLVGPSPEPGQFYQLSVGRDVLHWLRRPMSYYRMGEGWLSFAFRVVGEGTRHLASLRPGAEMELFGPLGHGFPLTEPGPYWLIGGGSGIPPLWDLARRLWPRDRVGLRLGGRTAADVLLAEHFDDFGQVEVLTEDGSLGRQGLAGEALPTVGTLFACGPRGLLLAVAQHAERTGQKAYLALEAPMACGFGACLGCTVEAAQPRPEAGAYGQYLRVCVEGPVFAAAEVRLA